MSLRPMILAAFALAALPGGDRHIARLSPVEAVRGIVTAAPVVPDGLTVSSRLTFVEGWALSWDTREFGGLSALAVEEGDLIALSDRGSLLTLDGGRFAPPHRARITPLPPGCADATLKRERDAEALALDPATGRAWIAFEAVNGVCVTTPDRTRGRRLVPPAMEKWPGKSGAEAMARQPDGTLLVLAERDGGGRRESPLLIFPKGRLDRPPVALRYRPPERFRPTDLAILPGGDLLIVNRNFTPPLRFSTIITHVERPVLEANAVLSGRAVALFRAPGIADNFEALAVDRQGTETYLWLASDDNFAATQKTYLLKFRWRGR